MGAALESRRRDPVALTWEPFALLVGGVLVGAVYALPAALAVAGGLSGGAWVWPGDPLGAAWNMVSDLPAAAAAAGAPPALAVVLVAVFELALAVTAVALAVRFGPALTGSRRTGFATPAQAQQVLGLARLRASRGEIRPDLYDRARRHWPHAGARVAPVADPFELAQDLKGAAINAAAIGEEIKR